MLDNWYWVDRPRRRYAFRAEDTITLFRAIPKEHQKWRLNIGRWWAMNPYQSLTFHFSEGEGELYVAKMLRRDIRYLELVWGSIVSTPLPERSNGHNREYWLLPWHQKFLDLRKANRDEIGELNDLWGDYGCGRKSFKEIVDIVFNKPRYN